MTDLIRIAERVQDLARADREVDGLIACAIFKTVKTDDDLVYLSPICKSDECAPGTYWLVQRSGRSLQTAPSYTASLDAAMSLVPTDHLWACGDCNEDDVPWACVTSPSGDCPDYSATGVDAACALTAAAIRSLAAQRGQS